ncbi:acylphosphatase [Lysobacter pythonis]|uniref:acylphosphatase n=1 Tax=Solilutibacter pythonis TaxID=2483112 RepID=A0A3M2HQ61_9GAMM|nr:acylphosphatase [Lysobacter pythonis]RMH89479.1 acylphosphatase [Lysobacter pythonis]
MRAAKFLVGGKVQGVWYRAGAQREAEKLGLCGHALNLPDGRVEVLAIGDVAALDALERWLRQGPPLARVDDVRREDIEVAGMPGGFRTG